MTAQDVFISINDADEATTQVIINRLEFRGKDANYTRWRDEYLGKMGLKPSDRVLEVGCGTGIVARALVGQAGFSGRVVAVDNGAALIEAARRFAAEEGVGDRIEFRAGDAHALDFENGSFDAVIIHTVLSHVKDPPAVVKEAARVVRPGGVIAIFDGDYASLSFGCSDPALAKAMEEAFVATIVNNPRVMRDLPRLLKREGLEIFACAAHVYAEMGMGSFWLNAAVAFTPLIARAG